MLRVVRAERDPVECATTGRETGVAELDFEARQAPPTTPPAAAGTPPQGSTYLVRVGTRNGAPQGAFRLRVFVPEARATAPGRQLPRGGVINTLDRREDVDAAYAFSVSEGQSYRVALSGPSDCSVRLSVFGPDPSSFSSRERGDLRCGESFTFTPRRNGGGRYSARVLADQGKRGGQPFRLQAAPAGGDDVAPGVFLTNYARERGRVDGSRVDRLDLYRFDVVRRSRFELTMTGTPGVRVRVVNDRGAVLQSQEIGGRGSVLRLQRVLRRGRYFLNVSTRTTGRANYRLRRVSRAITATSLRVRAKRALARPGCRTNLSIRVRGARVGAVSVLVERFDPNLGWTYVRAIDSSLRKGRVLVGFATRRPGRYRFRVSYLGSRGAGTSRSVFKGLLAADRLRL